MSASKPRIYLDNAATTALLPGVRQRMNEAMEFFGNPSSLHEHGRRAKHEIDWARERVSGALGCLFAEVVFTGSGTEAANLAIIGTALANEHPKRNRILLSAIEHHCVLNTRPILERLGYKVELIPVDRESFIRVDQLKTMLDDTVLLVSAMSVNNETGSIQKIHDIVTTAHEVGARVHSDYVQGFLKGVRNPVADGADLVSVAAHKVNGPKGVGALVVANGTKIKPLVSGGEQERELRGGTENVIGVVGFGAAVDQHMPQERWKLGDTLEAELIKTGALRTVHSGRVLDGHLHLRFPGIDAETILIRLDREGISASSGAACSSGSIEPSHVMVACGYTEEEAKEGLRFSLGEGNTAEEIEQAAVIITNVVQEIRERRR